VKIGYFAQHQLEQLDPHASALLHLQRLDPKVNEQDARNYLGSFNFMGDRVLEPVALFLAARRRVWFWRFSFTKNPPYCFWTSQPTIWIWICAWR